MGNPCWNRVVHLCPICLSAQTLRVEFSWTLVNTPLTPRATSLVLHRLEMCAIVPCCYRTPLHPRQQSSRFSSRRLWHAKCDAPVVVCRNGPAHPPVTSRVSDPGHVPPRTPAMQVARGSFMTSSISVQLSEPGSNTSTEEWNR